MNKPYVRHDSADDDAAGEEEELEQKVTGIVFIVENTFREKLCFNHNWNVTLNWIWLVCGVISWFVFFPHFPINFHSLCRDFGLDSDRGKEREQEQLVISRSRTPCYSLITRWRMRLMAIGRPVLFAERLEGEKRKTQSRFKRITAI